MGQGCTRDIVEVQIGVVSRRFTSAFGPLASPPEPLVGGQQLVFGQRGALLETDRAPGEGGFAHRERHRGRAERLFAHRHCRGLHQTWG